MQHARAFGRSALVTPHYLATQAGGDVLARGGNAVDALVAANLALGIVAPYYCGMGGDLLAMVWDGALHGYRSTGRSPASLTPARVVEDGHVGMPVFGAHTVTVPGAVRGWFDLLERWGTRSFGELMGAAVALADDGFVLTRPGARRLSGAAAVTAAMFPGADALSAAYGDAAAGHILRQPAAAGTLRLLASDGPNGFYEGPVAEAIVDALAAHGSAMTTDDLRSHRAAWPEPMTALFAGRVVAELPPPTQGVTALQMLLLAERAAHDRLDGVERLHLEIEIARAALADRDAHVGDPDDMRIDPRELLGADHLDGVLAGIDPSRAASMARRRQADGGTAYMCAADANGLMVSLIQSNFTALGSGVHVAPHGINLHNRGAAFSLDPGSPNVLAGSKLPMHTLIPAMVLDDGQPSTVFGTMGGQAQAQIHLQVLTRHLVDGDDPQRSVAAPRFEVNPSSGVVGLEEPLFDEFGDELARRGHDIRPLRALDDACGHAHMIDVTTHGYLAGGDPRAESDVTGR